MKKIMFVCYGNICRSPMAEFVMKKVLQERGMLNEYYVQSSATSYEEIGNSVYPPVKRLLSSLGIDCSSKRARRLTREDGETYDLILGMDNGNIRDIMYIVGSKNSHKVKKLLDFAGGGEVADPWYTRDFDKTYSDVSKGIEGLLEYLKNT
ncbi:MAG: low molecular weight phosphotyrosine protein phosphatase [Clostridia bacterium]|nr:low molecular weight phosphotyrosine protein phosphatase [Clostridia bacterium]